jgi:hypothetical protein
MRKWSRRKSITLVDLLEEEAAIVDEDKDTPKGDKIDSRKLRSAARKLRAGRVNLTKAEIAAAKDALSDLGDLYREQGTIVKGALPIPTARPVRGPNGGVMKAIAVYRPK